MKFEIKSNLPNLFYTDHNRLSQIVLNLLNNSLKFTFQGSVTLRAEAIGDNVKKFQLSTLESGSKKKIRRSFSKHLVNWILAVK